MKTAELEGAALDAAVAMAEGKLFEMLPDEWGEPATYLVLMVNLPKFRLPVVGDKVKFCPSTDWRLGGPILERENIQLGGYGTNRQAEIRDDDKPWVTMWGETLLIAAMRAYVASRLGDDVELP